MLSCCVCVCVCLCAMKRLCGKMVCLKSSKHGHCVCVCSVLVGVEVGTNLNQVTVAHLHLACCV